MKDDHIGPIDGLNFMSLNMTDEQLYEILRAINVASASVDSASLLSPEAALAHICNLYNVHVDGVEAWKR